MAFAFFKRSKAKHFRALGLQGRVLESRPGQLQPEVPGSGVRSRR